MLQKISRDQTAKSLEILALSPEWFGNDILVSGDNLTLAAFCGAHPCTISAWEDIVDAGNLAVPKGTVQLFTDGLSTVICGEPLSNGSGQHGQSVVLAAMEAKAAYQPEYGSHAGSSGIQADLVTQH